MALHPVRRALQQDVVPYLLSSRLLSRQWFYRLNSIFSVTTDVVVAFAAIGVYSPFLALLGSSSDGKKSSETPTLQNALATVPHWLLIPTTLLLVAWIFLRVIFNREEGQRRAVLARSCSQVLRQAEANLHAILLKADPMPDLTELLEKRIRPTVDRNIQEEAWPYLPFAQNIDEDVKSRVEHYCSQYESNWKPVNVEEGRGI